MTIEMFHLTAQIHRWLNASVAHHLEAQAARLTTTRQIAPRKLGSGRRQIPSQVSSLDSYGFADDTESIAPIDPAELAETGYAIPRDAAAGRRYPAAQMAMPDSENQTVRA